MDLDWKDVDIEVLNHNKRYKEKRIKLVSNACGHAEQGLLAIMGPSGSGKTTLIKALAGRLPEGSSSTGVVTLNGVERDAKTWVDLVGFVDQDDTIYEQLTARETVTYAAKFRLKDKNVNIGEKVEKLFKKLAVTHVLDCKMSNLSGGERKRVMIAIELVTDPQIIFLDEPTSGLDNNTTVKIIKLLKELSKEGRTILFTIHQPDDITAVEFDEILLLSQGRSVYMGKMANCEEYLISHGFEKDSRESFSNFAMKVLNVEPGIYHEAEESTKLNVLVNDVKERFGFSQGEKRSKTSNDWYANVVPNLYHSILLLGRRCKLELFTKKNIITTLITVASVVLILWQLKSCEKYVLVDKDNLLKGDAKTREHIIAEYPNLMDDLLKVSLLLHCFIFVGVEVAFIPMMTGMAFNAEHDKVKREISVNTYSISSYYLSVFLFEYLKNLPFVVLLLGGCRVMFGKAIDFMFIFTFFVMFSATITAYLFYGSILRGTKRVIMIFGLFMILNIFPFSLVIVSCKISKKIGKNFIPGYFLNLVPNYVLAACPYVHELAKFISDYSEIANIIRERSDDGSEVGYKLLIKEFKSLLIGRELPLMCNYLFGGILIVLYLFLCVGMLSIRLKPDYRMRLNKK